MYLDTFSRRARSLATILIFARVRILGTQCLFVIATVTKVSRKRGLWLVVRVIKELPGSLISHRGAPCAIYEMKFRADRPDQTYLPLFPYST